MTLKENNIVRNTERILACRSLLKADVDLCQEDLVTENEDIENFMSILEKHETDIYEVCLSDSSEEVARVIARYIVRTLQAKLKCEECVLLITVKRQANEIFYHTVVSLNNRNKWQNL